LRFAPAGYDTRLVDALRKLTGANPGNDWAAWMLWQEAHPEIGVLPGFARLQARVYDLIDPNFQLFLSGEVKHEIRLEEITWGGVIKDGIPALTNPALDLRHGSILSEGRRPRVRCRHQWGCTRLSTADYGLA
jgi:hypothetical protein